MIRSVALARYPLAIPPNSLKSLFGIPSALQKIDCALSCFCFTLIIRNTTKTRQDPCAKFWGKTWELIWYKTYSVSIFPYHKSHVFAQLSVNHLGIDLCRLQRGMPKHLAHWFNGNSIGQSDSGSKGMSGKMKGKFLPNITNGCNLLEIQVHFLVAYNRQ